MIKRYCDGCGVEFTTDQSIQPIFSYTTTAGTWIKVRVIRAVGGVWNNGDVCLACVRDAVANGVHLERDPGHLSEPARPDEMSDQ